jgi:hypothetical protein
VVVGEAASAGVLAEAVAGEVGPSVSDGRSGVLTGDLPGASVGVLGGMAPPGTGLLTLILIMRTRITVTTGPTILRRMRRQQRRMADQAKSRLLAQTRPEQMM